jgi:hypothetical protein
MIGGEEGINKEEKGRFAPADNFGVHNSEEFFQTGWCMTLSEGLQLGSEGCVCVCVYTIRDGIYTVVQLSYWPCVALPFGLRCCAVPCH